MFSKTRRNLIRLTLALPFIGSTALARTPRATEGPFYPSEPMRFQDADNNLVEITGSNKTAAGEVIILKGRVFDASGTPANAARVEIWQCDANGIYLHTDDRTSDYDSGFQGFGHVVTGNDGAYAFRTIKPVTYPGRTPHIHVKVRHETRDLTTQFYLDGHKQNNRDRIFRRMSAADQKSVSMKFSSGADGTETTVDIFL